MESMLYRSVFFWDMNSWKRQCGILLDITTEDKVKALATLEGENQKTVPKKWKNKNSRLTDFCGLKK